MKKLLSVFLVAVLILGMPLSASAATTTVSSNPVTGTGAVTTGIRGIISDKSTFESIINNNAASGMITINDSSSGIRSLRDLADLTLAPGDVIQIPLTADMFTYANGATTTAKNWVSTSALRSANITVRSSVMSGSGMLNISIDGNRNKSYIKIEAVKNPANDGKKFSYAAYLSRNGARSAATRLAVKGIVEAPRIEVSSGDDYVDISKGETLKALSNVRGVEIYLGNYCTITRNLVRNKEYSGVATDEVLAKDEPLFTKYPYLEYIYRLETIGLKAEGNIVTFDLPDNDKLYVYNTNGKFLGTADEALPYWTKYYLSYRKYNSIEVIK